MSSGMSVSATSMDLQYIQAAASVSSAATNNVSASASSEPQQAVYATEGDAQYDEAMDENSDGTITYEEYLSYVQSNLANASSASISPASTSVTTQTDDEGNVQPVNAGRALAAYSNAASEVSGLNSAVISAES